MKAPNTYTLTYSALVGFCHEDIVEHLVGKKTAMYRLWEIEELSDHDFEKEIVDIRLVRDYDGKVIHNYFKGFWDDMGEDE